MDAEEQIRIILFREKLTITELAQRLSERLGRRETVQNLSNKFRRGTVRYSEALDIAAALGYRIEWVKESA